MKLSNDFIALQSSAGEEEGEERCLGIFCALFEATSGGASLQEFFVGMTDAPAVDWMERYGLPGGLFSE